MSIELLENAAASLGALRRDVVFLGAATVCLWITDPAAPPLRPTADVDVVVEVSTLAGFNDFERRLRAIGFRDEGSMIGRFVFGSSDSLLDLIPADASLLGFDNRWQRASLPAAVDRALPSGVAIRAIPPPNLLATKLEAFAARGGDDYLGSADFEDIVAIVDGREELIDEVAAASPELRAYLQAEMTSFLRSERAQEAIAAHLEGGRDGRARAREIVMPRFERLTSESISS